MNWEVPIMRSKTLSSDLAIFKKDLTRFAPVWLGLCAWLAIWALSIEKEPQSYSGSSFYSPIAPIFAPILAIVVFGYLCDSRECNMVHSLPIRRERLFAIHTLSASVMFLVPTAVFCLLTRPLAAQSAGYRFVFLSIEFFQLFSMGVLCVMLTGRKIAAALLYLFSQIISGVIYIVVEAFYLPVLPGIYLGSGYLSLSTSVSDYANFREYTGFTDGDGIIISMTLAFSLIILGISLLLYRKRPLEHAGDLLTVSWLNPFFSVCAAATGVCLLYTSSLPFYLLGASIGYLAYWMLCRKTARIFNLRILGGLACLLAATLGSVYLVGLDPLNRVSYIPEPESVESVQMVYNYLGNDNYEATEPSEIAALEALHQDLLEHYIEIGGTEVPEYEGEQIFFVYHKKNGDTVIRSYICTDGVLQDRVKWYLSQPSALFGKDDPSFDLAQVRYNGEEAYFDSDLTDELIELVMEECRKGKMYTFAYEDLWRIKLTDTNDHRSYSIAVPSSAARVNAWLEANCEIK